MSMTAHTLATVAVGKARRDDIVVEALTPTSARIVVNDDAGTRELTVYTTVSGYPMLADEHRQVTLPEVEAVRALTAWIAGAELPTDADEEVAARTEVEAQRMFDAIFQAAADATAPGAADDDWPVGSGNDREWILAGPWDARLTFTARTDETGRLTGVAWSGRGADGASTHNHGGIEAATAAARSWAAGLDETPALTPAGLKARRQALGLSQAELGDVIDASQAVIAQWETGARAPRNPTQVATALAAAEDQLHHFTQQLTQTAIAHADHVGTKVVILTTLSSGSPIDSADLTPALHRTATGRAFDQLHRAGYHPVIEETTP